VPRMMGAVDMVNSQKGPWLSFQRRFQSISGMVFQTTGFLNSRSWAFGPLINYEKTGGAGVPPAIQSAQARRLCQQFFTTFRSSHSWAFGPPTNYEKYWRHDNLVLPMMAEDRSSVMLRARGSSLIWTSLRTPNCCPPIQGEHARQIVNFAMSAIVEPDTGEASHGADLHQLLRPGRA